MQRNWLYPLAIVLCASVFCPAMKLSVEQNVGISFTSALTTGKPGNVFQESDPVLIRFKDEALRKKYMKELEWRLTDWLGAECAKGICGPADAAIEIRNLPLGHYRFYIREKASHGLWSKPLTFARIVDFSSRRLNPDMPYAMGSCQSVLVGLDAPQGVRNPLTPENSSEIISELEKLAGLGFVREYMSWGGYNPRPGVFEWGGRNEQNANLLSQRGIRIVTFLVSCPQWTSGTHYTGLPQDFMALYRFTREAAGHFKNKIVAWELDNEIDGRPDSAPAWEFAAAQKVAYLGLKAGNPAANFLFVSVSATSGPPNLFTEMVMQNGMSSYFDTYNFHLYRANAYYPDFIKPTVQAQKDFLKKHGMAKPIWVTEVGVYGEGDGQSQADIPGTTVREHGEEQERMQAESLVKSQITMQSLGIEKTFSFVFPPYNEGGKVWGLLRYDYTVKPAYVALANLTEQLGQSTFLGTIDLAPQVFGFLFADPDGSRTLVAWTKDSDRTVSFKDRARGLRMVDLLGKQMLLVPENGDYTATVGRYPVYLRGLRDLKPTEPSVTHDTAATSAPTEDQDKEVVLRIVFNENQTILGRTAVLLDYRTDNQVGLDIFNFGKEAKVVALRNLGKGYELQGSPLEVRVPPMQCRTIPITIKFTSPEITVLKIGATVGRKHVSSLVVPVSFPLETNPAYRAQKLLTEDASRWHANSAGKMQIEFDSQEQAIRLQTTFPKEQPLDSSAWIYPEYLLKLPEESMAKAVGISFDVKVKEFDTSYVDANLMAVMENATDVYYSYKLKIGHKGWQTVVITLQGAAPAEFGPEAIKILRIGMNPQADDFTYWLKNVKVYYKKQ